jgi:hypothetical protein
MRPDDVRPDEVEDRAAAEERADARWKDQIGRERSGVGQESLAPKYLKRVSKFVILYYPRPGSLCTTGTLSLHRSRSSMRYRATLRIPLCLSRRHASQHKAHAACGLTIRANDAASNASILDNYNDSLQYFFSLTRPNSTCPLKG